MENQTRDIFAEARLFLKKAALKKEGWILDGHYERVEGAKEEPACTSVQGTEDRPA